MGCKKQTVNLQESICKGAIEHGNIVICNCHGNMPGICELWGFEGEDGLYGTHHCYSRYVGCVSMDKRDVYRSILSLLLDHTDAYLYYA